MNFSTSQKKDKLRDINSYILILFAFFIPVSIAFTNILTAVIILIWLLIGDFKNDWQRIKTNKMALAALAYFTLHLIGLLWTDSIGSGMDMLKKDMRLLLIPIFMLFVKEEFLKYYIFSFLSAMVLSVFLSFGIYFEIIPQMKTPAAFYGILPFIFHTVYTPLLTLSIYILMYYTFLSNTLRSKQKYIFIFLITIMSINLFISGGRTGQVMYFLMLSITLFQYFKHQRVKALVLSVVAIPLIFITFYSTSQTFNDRVNKAVMEVTSFQTNKNTSLGNRLNQLFNSIEIIKENPIIGVGTGGFKEEYKIMHLKLTPEVPMIWVHHPHNMYLLEYVELGIFGLVSLLLLLIVPIVHSFKSKDTLINSIGITMPILFALIMLSDTYLSTPTTTMFFVFFSSILYKDYTKQTI